MKPDTASTRVSATGAHTIYVPAVGRTRPMSVAIVTSIHPEFDARIWKHARLLAGAGHQVHLVCPWSIERGRMQDGVVFHTFAKPGSRALRIIQVPLRVIPRVLSVLSRVDVVHFHDIDLLPWMTLLSAAKPVVYDVHENYADEMLVREWIPKWARRPLANAVRWAQWALSHVVRNIVLVAPSQEPDFSSRRLTRTFIYNFASRDLLAAVQDDYALRPSAVIFVGSQHENNGSLLLLEIASLVAAARPDVTFLAVDRFMDASFRLRFLAEVSRRGLERTIRLFPNVKPHELMSVLNRATIGISPNLRVAQQIKGIHTKVFEYMAAGLPMVLSDLPHQLEVLRASGAGLAAAPERPAEFADAILRLVDDRSAAQRMGQSGQAAFLAKYSYESQLGEMLRFYRRVLGAPT